MKLQDARPEPDRSAGAAHDRNLAEERVAPPAAAGVQTFTPLAVLALQRAAGNQAVSRRLLQRAELADFNDADPKHDPSLLTDAQIKATDEFKALSTKTYKPRKGPAPANEALLACRLMLRKMRDTGMVLVTLMNEAGDYLDMAAKQLGTLKEAEKQVGTLEWRPFSTAAAVSDPSKLPTEFGRWLLAGEPMPDKVSGKINCWEMILFGAFKAGFLDFAKLQTLYKLGVDNVKAGKATSVGSTVEAELRGSAEHVFDPADPDSPKPLPGDLVVFKEVPTHVAIATGAMAAGKHQVISLWNQPGFISTVQRTTIEEILAVTGSAGRPVKFWTAKW